MIDMEVCSVRRRCFIAAIVGAVALGACDCDSAEPEAETSEESDAEDSAEVESADSAPHIPASPGEYSPSMARLAEGEEYDHEVFADTESCTECHAEQAHEWKESSHAFSSLNNPFYLVVFDDFLEEQGEEHANFCGGCHDPAPMFEGHLATGLEPDDPSGHLGITCTSCHGAVDATMDGNASYVLSTDSVPIPEEGDEESLQQHRDAVGGAKEQGDKLCVSCHRAFLSDVTGHDAAMSGIDDFTDWHRSAYAENRSTRVDEPIEPAGCIDCHMPPSGSDQTGSHRFPGGHSTLAKTIGSQDQLEVIRDFLDETATIDIPATGFGGFEAGATADSWEPGEQLWFDVVVFNEQVGHRFPAGARDLRDTFLEVTVRDAAGDVLAASGREYARGEEEPMVHRFRSVMVTPEGTGVDNHRVHQFRTMAFDHTIGPRDAATVRYAWDAPEDTAIDEPVTIEARLMHRRLDPHLAETACERSKQERGRGFVEFSEEFFSMDIDPCRSQPLIEIDGVEITLDQGGDATESTPQWRRALHHGLGLRHALQQHLDEAYNVLTRARDLVSRDDEATDNDRAQVLYLLGEVAARQNRHQQAFDYLEEAEQLVGEHPAIDRARGEAKVRVFRNESAQPWLRRSLEHRGGMGLSDDRTARLLASAYGSTFDFYDAYRVAKEGLASQPRDPDLLRIQSRALGQLDVPEEWSEAATEAFLTFRHDEQAAVIRTQCSKDDEECLLERDPVHTHELRGPSDL